MLRILSVSIHSGISSHDDEETGRSIQRIEDKSQYKKVLTGDLVFNMMRAWQGAIGVSRYDGMVSPAYIVAVPNGTVYPMFMDYCMSTEKMIRHIHRLSYGLVDFRLRLYWDSFVTIKVAIPCREEQVKITVFLDLLNKKIALQRRKVELLKDYKKGLMERLFYPGFQSTTWRSIKIGTLFDERSIRGNMAVPLLSVTIADGVVSRTSIEGKDNSSEDKSSYKCVEPGDIVYNSMRMWQGASGLSQHLGIVSPAYTILKPVSETNAEWCAYLFKTARAINAFRRASQGLTSDTWNLKYQQIATLYINMPNSDFQQKSVALMSAIGQRITLEANKLKQYEKHLVGLLQQMFV